MLQYLYTPGPWEIKGNLGEIGPNNLLVAKVHGRDPYGGWRTNECKANAHLVAAAPELLKALEVALPYLVNAGVDEDARYAGDDAAEAQARAAIAKAKGR